MIRAKFGSARALALSVFVFAGTALAEPRAIPPLSGPVIDEVGVLSRADKVTLESELRSYPPAAQLQIWIVDSLADEPIESLSIRAATEWKLGTAKDDRGILMLIALKDRRMRIEVGQGLEGEITDLQSGRILDGTLRPAFRNESYFAGILQASRQIYSLAGGTNKSFQAAPTPQKTKVPFPPIFLFFLLMILFNILGGGSKRRSRFYGVLGAGAFGARGGRGWGGGGGWSGGGGGFSGGGSSGSW